MQSFATARVQDFERRRTGIKSLACFLVLMGAKSICPVHFDVFNFLPPVLMDNCNIWTCNWIARSDLRGGRNYSWKYNDKHEIELFWGKTSIFLRGIEYSDVVTRNLSIACSGWGTLMYRMHSLLEGYWSKTVRVGCCWLLIDCLKAPSLTYSFNNRLSRFWLPSTKVCTSWTSFPTCEMGNHEYSLPLM